MLLNKVNVVLSFCILVVKEFINIPSKHQISSEVSIVEKNPKKMSKTKTLKCLYLNFKTIYNETILIITSRRH